MLTLSISSILVRYGFQSSLRILCKILSDSESYCLVLWGNFIDPVNESYNTFSQEYVEILHFLYSCFGFLHVGIVILLGLKRLHGVLEVTAALVYNGNYAKCAVGGKIACLKTIHYQEDKDVLKRKIVWRTRMRVKICVEIFIVTKMSTPATAEEKTKKKNDVKARGLLLMALPNEHQLTFSQYPDAKSSCLLLETRSWGMKATKKTQKTLLKQQ
ncbi:hypothetical protein Tco_1569947 [Tanacetum coccineum]